MKKLWDKGYDIDLAIANFTVGNDPLLDVELLPYDAQASIAHAKMLYKAELISSVELAQLIEGLELISKHGLKITQEDEDCHTAIEKYLTTKYGAAGQKIHTARSRNDQVLTALRLYELDALKNIIMATETLIDALTKHKECEIPMPGYTHMQKAMPTTIGVWLHSHALALQDSVHLLKSVLTLVDKSPLGAAAGFGVPVLDIDKKSTAKEMGFAQVMENPMHAIGSRGKYEASFIHACSQVLLDLNKLASDLILFSMPQFSYVSIPQELCTGSSIMPQKKNPDVLELVRASYHEILGEQVKVQSMIGNLISGYNRDVQLTKEPVMKSVNKTLACLSSMVQVVDGVRVNQKQCAAAMTPDLYATEKAYELVKQGVPFREAYQQVAKDFVK